MTVLNQWLSNSSWKTSALRLRKMKEQIQEMKREAEREQKTTEGGETMACTCPNQTHLTNVIKLFQN